MAPLKLLAFAVVAGLANAFSPSTAGARISTHLNENFGFGGASLDTYDAQPDLLKGEGEYKQYVNVIKKDNMLNRQVSRNLWFFYGCCCVGHHKLMMRYRLSQLFIKSGRPISNRSTTP